MRAGVSVCTPVWSNRVGRSYRDCLYLGSLKCPCTLNCMTTKAFPLIKLLPLKYLFGGCFVEVTNCWPAQKANAEAENQRAFWWWCTWNKTSSEKKKVHNSAVCFSTEKSFFVLFGIHHLFAGNRQDALWFHQDAAASGACSILRSVCWWKRKPWGLWAMHYCSTTSL